MSQYDGAEALIAQGCGAYGRTMEEPAEVLPAL